MPYLLGTGELVVKSGHFLVNVGYPGHPGCPLHAPEAKKREKEQMKEHKKSQTTLAMQKAQNELWQQILRTQKEKAKVIKPLRFEKKYGDEEEWH